MADVPIELLALLLCSPAAERSSQNARLLSSKLLLFTALYPPADGPSTNRLNPSCAVLAPTCAERAACAAAFRAWAAKSDSEI